MSRLVKGISVPCGLLAAALAAGCRTDISQQLLERELRMQEDQIYSLQDELQDKCDRLESAARENRSLRRQLGIVDADASLPSRISLPPGVASPAAQAAPTPAAPAVLPPRLTLPPPRSETTVSPGGQEAPGLRFGDPPGSSPKPPPAIAPPTLDGVPPLPVEPGGRGAADPSVRRLSYEESTAEVGRITHVVINPTHSSGIDRDTDGTSDALTIVFEPRDADGRLVPAAGDVTVVAFDPTTPGSPEGARLGLWEIPAAEALANFRRTSRIRGLHFTLPWQGRLPAGDHVRVFVKMKPLDGQAFETEATVPVR